MKTLRISIIALVAALIATPAPAQLIIYKGTVKQSETGQGLSEKPKGNCYLIVDHSTANVAQILYSTLGRAKILATTTGTNYHLVHIGGPKGKNIGAIAELGDGSASETVLAQGADSVLVLNNNVTVTFPKILTGTSTDIAYSNGLPSLVESTFVASFDPVQTPLSNQNGESLDAAVARISTLLEAQGYTPQQLHTSVSLMTITNDTMVTTWSDSYGRAQFGQRQNFFLGTYFINYYPQYFISYRDHSRSGASNLEMLTNRVPMMGIPDAGASFGKTNGLNIFYVSANGGFDSNSIYGLFKGLLQYPTNIYNRFGAFTHDWNEPNPQKLYQSIVIGDIAYNSADGYPDARDYSFGGRSAALEDGVPFVDTWANLVGVVTNAFLNGPNLWFNAPAFDHPANELHLIWTLTNLRSLGVDTNTYTAVLNFNARSVSSTNHCTVTGLSGNSTSLSFTFHADRMAPGFYVPDDVITNDCRDAFNLMPSLGNQFCEILRVTNLPPGNYALNIDGSNAVTVSSAQLSAGYNCFTNYSGAFWAQKKEILGLMCDMCDVLRSDASTDAHPGDNLLNERYESYATTRWPTNNFGVDQYIAQMSDRETELQAQDALIHAAAQQTNHIFTISLLP